MDVPNLGHWTRLSPERPTDGMASMKVPSGVLMEQPIRDWEVVEAVMEEIEHECDWLRRFMRNHPEEGNEL